MATRAATFTAKIRNLKDYHYRMINSVSPMPSGVDIANTLKYFSQSLLQVLKDVPIIPSESYGPRQRDSIRLSVFPNLNYSGLYESVMNIIDVVPMVQHAQAALGEAILNVIGCLVPFLEYDLLDTLPLTVAGTLAVFPRKLQKDIVDLLCTHLLPVTLGYAGMNDNPTYATDSTASVIMMTFQHCENGAYHSQVLECVMSMKKNTFKDLLSVMAYGPPSSRAPAVHHLFHYWPQLNPAHSDRRGIHYKYTAWTPVNCQRESCPNGGNVKAVKMCLDPALAIQCGDKPPPLYVCVDCVDQLRREHAQFLVDLLRPLEKVSLICENKNCTSPKNQAISTCFSIECASFNGFRPIRYCVTCHQNRHNSPPGSDHVFHLTIADVWSCEPDLQTFLVEAIVALLKEAQPMEEKRIVEMGEERSRHQHFEEEEDEEGEESEEHKLQSRYGIWLMVELCKPKEDIPIEILGRLLAMLFQWFDATAYLPDDNVGNALERLKPQYLYKWLQLVSKSHFEVMVSCLLPHPFEYARVGGHWDTLSSRTSQIKEGLNRMFCLVPYDIITYEVWNYVMPFWLEAIRTEVPIDERHELKVLLSKSFDTEMCPLPFAVDKMYHFVLERFDGTTAAVQDQNLQWLQILTSLDIWIPENILMNMFKTGVKSLANPQPVIDTPPPQLQQSAQQNAPPDYLPPGSPLSPSQFAEVFQFGPGYTEPPQEDVSDVTNLNCMILMLDLIIMQVQLQEIRPHQGLLNPLNKEVMSLLTDMLSAEWEGTHTCDTEEDIVECQFCEQSSLWHQLAAKLMEWMAPEQELKIPEKDLPKIEDIQHRTFTEKGKSRKLVPEVEEEDLDETEKQFKIQSLPSHLQLLHALLQTLEDESDSDALFFLLKTMKLLCLHGECLNYTQKEHRPFLKHCLAKRMIPNLWKLLQAEHSQIAIQCVPLLLHCLTLPTGADLLWKLVEDDFNNDDWRARFSAVEKVTVLARLLKIESIHNNQVIMTGLAHAFCYLIGCLNDTNTSIVERTTIYLETIKQSALRCMCQCMEFQFDSVINDRTLILQRLLLLQRVLKDEEIFSWHFFLNRFDTLCLEAQLDLESAGDISGQSLTDLASSDRQSEHFLKKINRARFALARTDSIRSVSGSIFAKPPYRRAASVPMHLMTRTQPPMKGKPQTLLVPVFHSKTHTLKREHETELDKDKPYPRQQSAPSFGRRDPRGSRFGLGMFSNYMFPGGQLREFTDEESNFAALLQRAMDLEGVDRETVHHLVALLMKFMILCDQERVNEDRDMSKEQNIVLRHLNMLLGYNQTEKAFSAPPYKLRYSAVFNSYISGLPMVLDRNFALGNIILPVSMALLQYVPSPQRYASDYQPPNYSLWLLEPHCRIYWLQVLIVILYKYQYNIAPACNTIQTLVRITMNTIENQLHHCKRHEDTFGPASPMVTRNRDTSNVSVGDLENIQETDTPPQSPTDSQASAGDTVMFNLASSTAQYRRKADSDLTEDTDVESISPSHKASLQAQPLDPSAVAEIESTSIIYTEDTTTSTKSCLTTPPRPSTPAAPTEDLALPSSPSRRTISNPSTAPAPSSAHSSPARTAPSSSPKRSPVHRAATLPPRVGSPTEELARLQGKGQPRRIAEYTAGSLTELRERPPSPSPTLQRKGTFQNFQLSKQRTLEQSVEEYMMQQIGIHAKEELVTPTSPSSPHQDLSVEHKMIEQIQAFESQNESKKKPVPSGSDQSSPEGPESSPTDETSDDKPVKLKDLKEETNKTEQSSGKEVTQDDTITELVVISEDSPKKLKYPLGKARSAGLLEASNTDSGSSPEFTGVRSRPQRAMSEKSANKVQTGQLEKPGKDDTHQNESELDETSPTASPTPVPKLNPSYRQRKTRKSGLTTVELQKKIPELVDMAASSESTGRRSRIRAVRPPRRPRKSQLLTAKAQGQHKRSIASMKYEQTVQVDRCPKCNTVLESYDEDCLSMCIVALSTFIHREPALAAPLLFDMLECVARIAASTPYPWQAEISGLIIPGNCVSVARQFIRCVLHQLAPNGIFPQLFQTEIEEPDFLKTLAIALVDFIDLNCYSALQLVLEGVNEMKNITCEQMTNVVKNIATFVDYIAMETSSPTWATILVQFDLFFRRLPTLLPNPCDVTPVLKIMIAVLKIPGLTSVKGILEPFSKLLTFTVQSCSFKLQQLLDICSLCNRAFTKERDKLYLSRSVIFELVQALKFKSSLPDENLLMLVQFVCIDSGGTIGPINISEELSNAVYNPYSQSLISTNAAECIKQHLNDCVEFISDLHTINKVKNNLKGGSLNLNEDTLGSHLKAGIAQFVALEFTRGNGRDNRAISRYLPWLYHPPTAMQQGQVPSASDTEAGPNLNRPKEFIDCVGHIRLLSWLLLGSLSHTAITKANGCITCQPIPLEASPHIADHIMVIMTGFAEQSKASVLHMSSLFHAFILCQLWTMYCESFAALSSPLADSYTTAHGTVMDFWARVTPGILQLLSHSKVMSEMVNLHFLGLIEALQECNSTILSKLFPMWTPILFAYNSQLPGHMQVRLSMCQNWQPKESQPTDDNSSLDPSTLLTWLKRLQFKLGQIEVQSSQATQFYTV